MANSGAYYYGEFVTPEDVGMDEFLDILRDSSTGASPPMWSTRTIAVRPSTTAAPKRCRYCGALYLTTGTTPAPTCSQCGAVR